MEMKRIFAAIAALIVLVGGLSAQTRMLVTLSHDGELTFFDNSSALEDAIDASVNGDIIYLSDGKFGASKQSITIENKKISIIGNGYNSHIIPDITFRATNGSMELVAPLFDGVRLETLQFSAGLASYSFQNIEIKKCFIGTFEVGYFANNIMLDRCKILTFTGHSSTNVNVYNCKIDTFTGTYCEVVENCNIKTVNNNSPSYITNSIVGGFSSSPGRGIYENCLIGSIAGEATAVNTENEYRNCYDLTGSETTDILDDDLECTISDMSGYVGLDGTVVGIYGGEWFHYSETPSVPTVDAANSSVEYDKDNNQLKVTITVAPN